MVFQEHLQEVAQVDQAVVLVLMLVHQVELQVIHLL
jgi:hypothetical protein